MHAPTVAIVVHVDDKGRWMICTKSFGSDEPAVFADEDSAIARAAELSCNGGCILITDGEGAATHIPLYDYRVLIAQVL